ncbi:MAG: tetratricopeptide repeat protein [Myxococcus sp.]|nr:tetratricopeptide repeat protein [Myxococcus sp.]
MRTALLLTLSAAVATAAPTKPVIALMPPSATDDELRDFGLMLEARAAELLEQSGRFSELHLKQVLAMADAEGLPVARLSEEATAKQARVFLGADRVVTVALSTDAKQMTLTGAVIDAKKTTRFNAKLPITWPEALTQGSEAVAQAVLATEKASLPKAPVAQPASKSPEALRALAQCYALVIRQPLGIDNPAVLDGEELDRASALCRKALEHDPSLRFAHAVLALARAIIGDAAGATAALNSLDEADDVVEPYTLARFWMVTRYQSNEAGLASLRAVLQRHPGELIARAYLADTQGLLNDQAGAEASWREYLAADPGSPFAWGRLSKALARQGRHDEAIDAAKKGLALAPTSKAARLELGSRLIDANKLDEAIAALRQLTDAKGEAVLRLGWAHWLKGDVAAAAPLFEKALATATGAGEWRTRGRAHYNLAMVHARRGDPDAARAALRASMQTGYKVRAVDPTLEAIAREVERADLQKEPKQAPRPSLVPTESSLVPFDPAGEPDLTRKKPAPPQGFIIYKF